MYDAQQGSSSGAHIDMSTKSGTNVFHGGSICIAAPTGSISAFLLQERRQHSGRRQDPQLHRYTAGGEIGGPIIKDKLFGFAGYQHLHVSDQETGDELLVVPPD